MAIKDKVTKARLRAHVKLQVGHKNRQVICVKFRSKRVTVSGEVKVFLFRMQEVQF